MPWLTAYLMGVPSIGLYTLSWTHCQTPMFEIKSSSNESVVSITKKLLLCTTPSFEALTGLNAKIPPNIIFFMFNGIFFNHLISFIFIKWNSITQLQIITSAITNIFNAFNRPWINT